MADAAIHHGVSFDANGPPLKTFGTAGKEQRILSAEREAELFRHDGRGCLTHLWFGGDWPGYGKTRIRCYIDGEKQPSIDMELFLGHGIGLDAPAGPWGTARLGKTGHPSGLYNTYRIPFGESIRITGQLAEGVEGNPEFWWITRGIENLPLTLGPIRLPDSARLRLYRRESLSAGPLEMVELCHSRGAGALYQVTLAVQGPRLDYLEACLRAYLDGQNQPLLLSSGTEDYFLGTYYFNRGPYHTPVAGVTHLGAETGSFSGYRFHEDDPILFQRGLRLLWRNGETQFWAQDEVIGNPGDCVVSSYVWVYQW
jgi:hypothetical protein